MLPVSLVDNSAFREYINYLDPSFSIPSRKTIKDSSLPKLKECIENKIKVIMSNIKHPNVCTDLWTDSIARPFNGFVFQGIDNDWQLKTFTCAFDYIEGNIIQFVDAYTKYYYNFFKGRHTGINIKKEYDRVIKLFDVQNKVFKIVADQAANNKKAFGLENENDKNDELVKMTKDLLAKQKKEDLQIKQLDWEKDYEHERKQMELVKNNNNDNSKKRKRAELVLEELEFDLNNVDYEDDLTDNTNVGDDSLDELKNIEFSELIDDILDDEEISNI